MPRKSPTRLKTEFCRAHKKGLSPSAAPLIADSFRTSMTSRRLWRF
jgi:hypothetical protein